METKPQLRLAEKQLKDKNSNLAKHNHGRHYVLDDNAEFASIAAESSSPEHVLLVEHMVFVQLTKFTGL